MTDNKDTTDADAQNSSTSRIQSALSKVSTVFNDMDVDADLNGCADGSVTDWASDITLSQGDHDVVIELEKTDGQLDFDIRTDDLNTGD